MNPDKLKLAVAQMTSVDQLLINLERVMALYAEAVAAQADLIVFPENTLYFRIRSGSKIEGFSWEDLTELKSKVSQSNTAVLLTTPIESEAGKLTNSTILFEPGAEPRVVYSKVHLFDVDVAGAPPVRESDYFESGVGPRDLDFRGWKIGLSICYDVRFSELFLPYAQNADLILVPSAFLVPTGEAHWHTLLRARAIEAQAYLAAPAQTGEHVSGDQIRRTFGHSLVVDPWGKVLVDMATKPGLSLVELSRETIAKVRQQIPMKLHRRL
jgi:deaminated glutathione amidase